MFGLFTLAGAILAAPREVQKMRIPDLKKEPQRYLEYMGYDAYRRAILKREDCAFKNVPITAEEREAFNNHPRNKNRGIVWREEDRFWYGQ